jgi:hypothetical protein
MISAKTNKQSNNQSNKQTIKQTNKQTLSGWWFGTCFFHNILGRIIPTD